MTTRVVFRMAPRMRVASFAFPDKCVYCGGPKEQSLDGDLSYRRNLQRYTRTGLERITESTDVAIKLQVPFCREHQQTMKKAKPILVGALLLGVIVGFLLLLGFIMLVLTLAGFTQGDELSSWLGTLLLLGGGGVFALGLWLPKWIIGKLFVPYLKDISLWSIFSQGEKSHELHALGLTVRAPIQSSDKFISFAFANEEIAEEFRQLNADKNPSPKRADR